jgi:hypothetical protein
MTQYHRWIASGHQCAEESPLPCVADGGTCAWPLHSHPMSSRIADTPSGPRTSVRAGLSASTTASATWSTWMGEIVSAFAIDARGDCAPAPAPDIALAAARSVPAGVGIPCGTLPWMTADASRRTASGEVSGRKCAWYTRPLCARIASQPLNIAVRRKIKTHLDE